MNYMPGSSFIILDGNKVNCIYISDLGKAVKYRSYWSFVVTPSFDSQRRDRI